MTDKKYTPYKIQEYFINNSITFPTLDKKQILVNTMSDFISILLNSRTQDSLNNLIWLAEEIDKDNNVKNV